MKILKKIFEGDAHHDLKVVQQIKISLKKRVSVKTLPRLKNDRDL